MSSKFKSWFIRTGVVKTHSIEAGEGDPLILIHAVVRARAVNITGVTTSRSCRVTFMFLLSI